MKDFTFKKSLGQNFLHNPKVISRIANLADIKHDDIIIEIGCGNGSLTSAILDANPALLIVVEIDDRCINMMQSRLNTHANFSKLQPILQDALTLDIESLKLDGKVKIISNLPYSVGTRIFINLLLQGRQIESMTLMFQKEVAKRIVAQPKSKDYGLLSLIAASSTDTKIMFDVSPNDFTPKPKVTSTVIACQIKPEINADVIKLLLDKGKVLFSNRRKMIRSYCKSLPQDVLDRFGSCRVETLGIDDILHIAQYL